MGEGCKEGAFRIRTEGAASSPLSPVEAEDLSDPFAETLRLDLRVVEARSRLIDLEPDARIAYPRISQPVMHLVLAGEVTVETDDVALELGPGDLVLAFYGDGHIISVRGNTMTPAVPFDWPDSAVGLTPTQSSATSVASILSFALDLSYLPPATNAVRVAPSLWSHEKDPEKPAARPLLLGLDQIRQACSGPGASVFLTSLASLLLVHSLRSMHQQIWRDKDGYLRARSTRQVAAAISAMEAHPDRSWSVAQLAQTVGTSRSTFAAAFKGATGETPHAYLKRVRLDKAKMLIEASTLPIAEIARRSGYSLPASFSRAFAEYHGFAPTSARERRNEIERRRAPDRGEKAK